MKTFQLSLTEAHLAVINDALMMAPFGRVAPVVQAINGQLAKAQPAPGAEPASHVEGAWAVGGTE